MVRIELAAADSLAAIRARSKFGIAIAAMIRMIATTISNSISEKPFCFRISIFPSLCVSIFGLYDPVALDIALTCPKPLVTMVSGSLCGKALFSAEAPTRVLFRRLTVLPKPAFLAKYGESDDNSCQVRTSSAFQYGNEARWLSCAPNRTLSIMGLTADPDRHWRLA